MESVMNELISFPADVLLLRLPVFTSRHLIMASKVIRKFHNARIFVLSREIDPSAKLKAQSLERFNLLQEPLEVADLPAIIEKQFKGENRVYRQHPRARRKGMVQIIDETGAVHRGQFLDFAQMGARLSLSCLEKLKPKSNVQIVYGSLSEPGKYHKVEAKIIWSAFTGGLVDQFMGGTKQQTAGIRFIAAY